MKYLAYLSSVFIIFVLVICSIVLGVLPRFEKNSVYISGQYTSDATLESVAGQEEKINLSLKGVIDSYLAKYDEDGIVTWAAKQYSTTENKNVEVIGVTHHDSGIYICGTYDANMIAESGFGINESDEIIYDDEFTKQQSFFAKYDQNGKVIWTARIISNDDSNCMSTVCDNYNNVYVSGRNDGIITLEGSDSSRTLVNPGIFLAKYDQNGDILWATSIYGTASILSEKLGIDSKNNVYITGFYVQGSTIFSSAVDQTGEITLEVSNSDSGFLAKYDQNGKVVWAKRQYDTSDTDDVKNYNLAVDYYNNIYIAGQFGGNLNLGETSTAGILDSYVAKYNENGDLLWVAKQSSTAESNSTSVGIDRGDNVYIAGIFGSDITFYSSKEEHDIQKLPTSDSDYFFAKYNSSGKILWATKLGPRFNDKIDMTLDSGNNIYLTGEYSNSITMDNYEENKYGLRIDETADSDEGLKTVLNMGLDAVGNSGFIAKYNNNGTFIWAANQLDSKDSKIS